MSTCPVCSGDLADGDLILVCAPCRERLGGAVHMRATGEFKVPDEIALPTTPIGPAPGSAQMCSWCGKDGLHVRKLLGTRTAAICDECVALCADILEAELGPDWR